MQTSMRDPLVVSRDPYVRSRAPAGRMRSQPTKAIAIGDHVFDLQTRTLSCRSKVRSLNPVEYAVLAELVRHPHVPITREHLVRVSHEGDAAPRLRSVDTAVMRLRRLVEAVPSTPVFLQTVYGRGYKFDPRGDAPS
jgi:two-component system phosphate regulon response regulator OmpR